MWRKLNKIHNQETPGQSNNTWGWNPPFWYAVFRGVLGRTQYAKGQYAVRNNSVKSYAELKNIQFFIVITQKYHTAIENARLADK